MLHLWGTDERDWLNSSRHRLVTILDAVDAAVARYRVTMTSVPEHLRSAVATELDQLVAGNRPEMLIWVREYGTHTAPR